MAQPAQFSAYCILGELLTGPVQQLLLQERDGPIIGKITPLIGRGFQQSPQQGHVSLGPQCRAANAVAVRQRWLAALVQEAIDPVVDTLTADVQEASQFTDGPAPIDFEDHQQAPIQAGVGGLV
jgi:hypothetical protein